MLGTARGVLGGVAVALLLGPGPAAASDQLDGVYVLDIEASDDLGELMKQLGMNPLMRSVVKRMRTRLTVDGEPDQVTLTVKTPVRTQSQTMATDGAEFTVEGGEFGSGTMSLRWEDGGASLVTVADTVMDGEHEVHSVTTRRLEDPDTLLQQFELSIDGGETMTIRRIFRREE